jgi:hypothetical protein
MIVDKKSDLNVYKGGPLDSVDAPCCGGGKLPESSGTEGLPDVDFNVYAGSFSIYAVKS